MERRMLSPTVSGVGASDTLAVGSLVGLAMGAVLFTELTPGALALWDGPGDRILVELALDYKLFL